MGDDCDLAEQVEGEWRKLIEKLASDDEAVVELMGFIRPWDKSVHTSALVQ